MGLRSGHYYIVGEAQGSSCTPRDIRVHHPIVDSSGCMIPGFPSMDIKSTPYVSTHESSKGPRYKSRTISQFKTHHPVLKGVLFYSLIYIAHPLTSSLWWKLVFRSNSTRAEPLPAPSPLSPGVDAPSTSRILLLAFALVAAGSPP